MGLLQGWSYRKKLTIDKNDIDSNLNYLRVLVSLDVGNFDFSKAKADGSDIRFTASDGTTVLDYDREVHDSINDIGSYFVEIPSVSSSVDTIFYMYYGNATASDGENSSGTWDGGDAYDGVWHLKEDSDGSVDEFEDSTGNGNDGQGNNIGVAESALIYKCQQGGGLTTYIGIPDDASWDFGSSNFNIEFSTRWDGSVTTGSIMGHDNGSGGTPKWILGFGLTIANNMQFHTSGQWINFSWTPAADTDYHCSFLRTGNTWKFYVNGTQVGGDQTNSVVVADASNILTFFTDGEGWQYHAGYLDEIRITNGASRTAAYLKANAESLLDDLLTLGSEEVVSITDVDIDIRVKIEELFDMATDIRAKYKETIEDIDIDIRLKEQAFIDLATDIRVRYTDRFEDLDLDIRIKKELIEDINTDIRVAEAILFDIDTDIRVKESIILDIETDIRVANQVIIDINTDIRAVHIRNLNRTIVSESPSFDEGYYLNNQNVTINMEKVYNAVKMQFKNELGGTWSVLETFDTTKSWVLLAGDGKKEVYLRFMDVNGNLSNGEHVIESLLTTTGVPSLSIEAYTDEGAGTPILDSTYQLDKSPFFRWDLPSYDVPFSYFSYAMDETPDDSINLTIPAMIQTGMLISKVTPPPQMTLEASDGYYYYANDRKEFKTYQITIDDGGVQDRIDVIYISGVLGSLLVEKGVEAATPIAPTVNEQDFILLAEVYVPAGTVDIANVTLTDTRITYIDLKQYLTEPLLNGQHILTVRAYTSVNTYSTSTFNIWVANDSLDIGELKCYTDSGKVLELSNGIYQTADNTPYFEWSVVANEPGPIRYYYTEDGTEPDLGDSFLITNNYTPGTYPDGTTVLNVRAYDTTTGYWGESKSFMFLYGTTVFTDDTVVISGNTFLRQSLKEVQVKDISWDFSSARICRFYQTLAFDANLPFSEGDVISVVYGASNSTIFSGRIMQIERTIDIGHEGVMYHCSGPRQDLNEEYAYVNDSDFGETAQITFDNVSLASAISVVTEKFPKAVKNIESYPSGANISDEYIGQVASNVLDSIYAKTKYNWYMKPNGSLVSVDLTASNSEQAKFGIYGTTVNAISPQYNVMASNLQFDITNRYNKCIIEGARKLERVVLPAHCGSEELLNALLGSEVVESWDGRFKLYKIDSKWDVVKIIKTYVSFSRLLGYEASPLNPGSGPTASWYIVFLKVELARDNILTTRNRSLNYGNFAPEGDEEDTRFVGYTPWGTVSSELPQGTLGPDNTIRFSQGMWHMWPIGSREGDLGMISRSVTTFSDASSATITSWWRADPVAVCASVRADVIIETVPLKVEVTVPGTASSISKTLRIVNTSFKYDEDPENLINDTARMTEYANDILQKYKDIKISGSITLDTIDLDWDLDKTVNLINTDQASWSSLNAKVIGIKYDFDANTTTLEITSEYLK